MNAIILSLDGVLIDSSKELHYRSLNQALSEVGSTITISEQDRSRYDGLTTRDKLKLLEQEKGLPNHLHDQVWNLKQNFTYKYLDLFLEEKPEDYFYLYQIKREANIPFALCTNSIRSTANVILNTLKVRALFDCVVAGDEVANGKPSLDMHFEAAEYLNILPADTLVLDDSETTLAAAQKACFQTLKINGPVDLKFNLKELFRVL